MQREANGVIRSDRSDKTLAVATGVLVARMRCADETACASLVSWFEREIDAKVVSHRTGDVTYRYQDGVLELRGAVEYGPVLGVCKSDLQKQLKRVVRGAEVLDAAVLNFKRRELTTADAAELLAKADDITVSLDVREKLETIVALLRA